MKLEKWALIAEIFSGLAVVITLIVLILGIRENSDLTRLSIYRDTIDSMNRWNEGVVNDPELAGVMRAFVSNQDIRGSDYDLQTRFGFYLQSLFRLYETAWLAQERDTMGAMEWGRFARVICQNYDRVIANDLDFIRATLTDGFWDYMESTCGSRAE